MRRQLSPEVALSVQDVLGEGPVWDDVNDRLWTVDIGSGRVRSWSPTSGSQRVYPVADFPSAVILTDRPSVLVPCRDELKLLDTRTEDMTLIDTWSQAPEGGRWNDVSCDRSGALWLGYMQLAERRQPGSGLLVRWEGRAFETMCAGLTVPNGLGWSPDGRRQYFIDSPSRTVAIYEANDATLGRQVDAIDLRGYPGVPDGMCVAEDGSIFVAFWDGAAVRRLSADGRLIAEILLPVTRPTSCCLGGYELSTLFITTARYGLTESQSDSQPLAGGVFAVDAEVRGMHEPRWTTAQADPRNRHVRQTGSVR